MVHSQRPLQEKMALFWHNHFATAYSKVAGAIGAVQATKMMALKAGRAAGPAGPDRDCSAQHALGNFRDLLIEVAKDPAMIVWLDGRTNTRQRPQENFGREIMELFTFGVGNYTEQDVYAAARVFTGWNIRIVTGGADDPNAYYEFVYNANQHEPTAKTFTFPIYPDGSKTIPARVGRRRHAGRHRLHHRAGAPSRDRAAAGAQAVELLRQRAATAGSGVRRRGGVQRLPAKQTRRWSRWSATSCSRRWFQNPGSWYTRYSWPVEFVVRAIKEVGWSGFSVDTDADAADQHGADAVRAARRERLGARARGGSRPAPCSRA